jgi:hypothetical protein
MRVEPERIVLITPHGEIKTELSQVEMFMGGLDASGASNPTWLLPEVSPCVPLAPAGDKSAAEPFLQALQIEGALKSLQYPEVVNKLDLLCDRKFQRSVAKILHNDPSAGPKKDNIAFSAFVRIVRGLQAICEKAEMQDQDFHCDT